jgi:hypothetical protein
MRGVTSGRGWSHQQPRYHMVAPAKTTTTTLGNGCCCCCGNVSHAHRQLLLSSKAAGIQQLWVAGSSLASQPGLRYMKLQPKAAVYQPEAASGRSVTPVCLLEGWREGVGTTNTFALLSPDDGSPTMPWLGWVAGLAVAGLLWWWWWRVWCLCTCCCGPDPSH